MFPSFLLVIRAAIGVWFVASKHLFPREAATEEGVQKRCVHVTLKWHSVWGGV